MKVASFMPLCCLHVLLELLKLIAELQIRMDISMAVPGTLISKYITSYDSVPQHSVKILSLNLLFRHHLVIVRHSTLSVVVKSSKMGQAMPWKGMVCVCLVSFFDMVTADDSLDMILQTSPKEPI